MSHFSGRSKVVTQWHLWPTVRVPFLKKKNRFVQNGTAHSVLHSRNTPSNILQLIIHQTNIPENNALKWPNKSLCLRNEISKTREKWRNLTWMSTMNSRPVTLSPDRGPQGHAARCVRWFVPQKEYNPGGMHAGWWDTTRVKGLAKLSEHSHVPSEHFRSQCVTRGPFQTFVLTKRTSIQSLFKFKFESKECR